MSVFPTESNIGMEGRGILGKPTSGAGKSSRLTAAQLLDEITLALAEAPTTEPVAPDVVWVDTTDNGVVKLSVGIPPAFTTHPTSQTKNEGETVTFTWAATNATSYQLQKQEGGSGSWANVSGATTSPWTSATLTNAADSGDTYRVVATGPGGTTNSNTATLSVLPPAPLTDFDAVIAISPQYLVPEWQAASQPTVRVEKGWASGTFADLFPHTDGKLYTASGGGGQTATAYAAGAKLFVHLPYNQCLASKDASGHPTAISDSRRVLLDLTVETSPCFAGLNQGSQDASQHATERGYDTNVSVTSSSGLSWWALDSGASDYYSFQNNGGSTLNVLTNPDNSRWYDSAISVVNKISAPSLPHVKGMYIVKRNPTPTTENVIGVQGGFRQGAGVVTGTGTATPMRIWGPTLPLVGRAYAFVMAESGEVSHAAAKQIAKRLHTTCKNMFAASEVSLYGPKLYQGYPVNLGTGLGSIVIELASGPGRVIEASFNGGAWSTIGTTDDDGYLTGSLSAAAGIGTVSVRVQGQSTGATVSSVTVGLFVATLGQSNALGRGDDFTLASSGAGVAADWEAVGSAQKAWTSKFADNLAVANSVPVILGNFGTGGSYLHFDAGGTTDGRHGHWAYNNPGTTTTNHFAVAMRSAAFWYGDANYTIWHQGESEGLGGVTEEEYKTSLVNMWTEWKTRTGQTGKLWVMQIGRNGVASDSATDTIRRALVNVVADRPDLFEFGGALAHLAVEDTLDSGQLVHFYTQAQKNAVVAVFTRHAIGSGRAHRYSSGSKATSTATLTFTGGSGDLVVGASPTLGWTCTDGSGSITVTGVSASGDELTLTFNRSISGSLTIKWCSHYSGIDATISDSDATTPLPPEPFEVTL